ncbi:hypothetical protein ACFV6D_11830 [Kitasatospora sp. NPDC059812]|uniref:hypothetical protein n=1 Tax=Kitasatospora sp. NPDC059812 TaxID=3346958 RepID=UPI00365A5559
MTATSGITSVGIVGGSLAGLFHAVALTALGLDVDVWERSTGRPDDRGAGIVLQPDVAWFLREFCGVDPEHVSVPVTHRQFFSGDGDARTTPMRQQVISWGAIYQALRNALPAERYHDGQPVTALAPGPAGATIHVGGAARAVDLAIIADGSASRYRALVTPDGAPRYAGYVAYRGVVDEVDARATRMRNHRILLTGDAAFVVRPHTAASTEKAAGDAITLFQALRRAPSADTALQTWERLRLAEGAAIQRQGVNLGRRLSLDGPEAAAGAHDRTQKGP